MISALISSLASCSCKRLASVLRSAVLDLTHAFQCAAFTMMTMSAPGRVLPATSYAACMRRYLMLAILRPPAGGRGVRGRLGRGVHGMAHLSGRQLGRRQLAAGAYGWPASRCSSRRTTCGCPSSGAEPGRDLYPHRHPESALPLFTTRRNAVDAWSMRRLCTARLLQSLRQSVFCTTRR